MVEQNVLHCYAQSESNQSGYIISETTSLLGIGQHKISTIPAKIHLTPTPTQYCLSADVLFPLSAAFSSLGDPVTCVTSLSLQPC